MARMGREFSLVLLGSGMLAAGSFLWPAEDLAAQAANAGAQQVAGNAARHRGGHLIFLHTFGGRAGPNVAAGASVSRGGFGGMGRSITLDPRPNWQKRVEEHGLHFHTLHGERYWDESAAYQLSRFEVDQLELATNTLHEMCLELVQDVIDQKMFGLFLIPPEVEDWVVKSWEQDDPSIYGRFDFAYNGVVLVHGAGNRDIALC